MLTRLPGKGYQIPLGRESGHSDPQKYKIQTRDVDQTLANLFFVRHGIDACVYLLQMFLYAINKNCVVVVVD